MKTKLISVTYLGYTAMERRFSTAMLPWLVREIRTTGMKDKLSIVIEDGYLKAYNGNFEPVLVHRLVDIIRASQVPGKPEELFYILYNEKESLLNCYLFRAATVNEVTDLFTQMREPSSGAPSPRGSTGSLTNGSVTRNLGFSSQTSSEHLPWNSPAISLPGNCNSNLTTEGNQLMRSSSNASTLTSLSADLSPSDSHFFEVLYIGKVRISQRKVPESLIDDALNKFAQHEAEKALRRRHSLLSSTGTSLYSNNSQENVTEEKKPETTDTKKGNLSPSTTPLEPDKAIWKSIDSISAKENKKDNKKVKDTREIDDEFDMFTKERVETKSKRPNSINLDLKLNLGTVEEEKDIKKDISETALNISKYYEDAKNFETNALRDKTPNPFNDIQSEFETKINNKQDTVLRIDEPFEDVKNLDNVTSKIDIVNKIDIANKLSNIAKHSNLSKTNESPSKINFGEIKRKPVGNVSGDKSMPENKLFLRDRSASIGTISSKTTIAQLIGEQNRTMLFQVGRSELRLISPDRKQILLHRGFKDVASCVLGRGSPDHFGFVCRETNDTYACYVFKCESDSVAVEVVNAIKQAFVAHAEFLKKSRDKSPNMTCEHCPMLWYHRLCQDVDGMNDKKTHAFILRRIEQLSDEEQDLIITKYQGGTNHMYETSEHNAFLMMLLRAHCEAKQQRHVHDTAENRSEFLNQYLGGSTIFMKAKRSLSSGFDHLLKRKASQGELTHVKKEPSPFPTPVTESEPSELVPPQDVRCKSLSPAVLSVDTISETAPSPKHAMTPTLEEEEAPEDEGPPGNSPMMDIYLKVSDNRPAPAEPGADPHTTWRQAIYQKVIQPSDSHEGELSTNLLGKVTAPQGKRSREQLRELWKMAIDQTILLVRMEKENVRLKEREESSAVRRIKLEYNDLGTCDAGVVLMWDHLLASPRPHALLDRHMLTQAVIQGVPRVSRGAVWYFLAEQASLRAPPPDTSRHPQYHTPYRTLLSGLTKHQHAILIDLGRTFPKHSYFASALGPGQLALYNILKAYSMLDPDVGYCQGLSFVAGVLLLHMEEAEAFILLRHLMFRRGLRKQYLPDMSALQVQLYQLSRLLRDHEPELHSKLEQLDISPALYAAPWMLTLFTSQFPLGFVVRVFDLLFLESFDVIFCLALATLSAHKDGLMMCESCEEAAEYLKHKLPDITPHMYHKIMKKVHTLDVSRQLSDYAVEYAVLREQLPRAAALAHRTHLLQAERDRVADGLDSAMDAITSYQKNQARLEAVNKSLEQQLTFLSRYISAQKHETPPEIRKIVQNHSKKLSFSTKLFTTKFSSNEDEEKKLKSQMSTPNLFANINKTEKSIETKESPEREKRFIMKKSQSVHSGLIAKPLKVLEEINETQKDPKRPYFANTHEQIRQERLFEQQLKNSFDENLKKLDEKQQPKEILDENQSNFDEKLRKLDAKLSPTSYLNDLNFFQSRKSMSLNIDISKNSEVSQNSERKDSGFVTPITPEKRTDSSSTISHPLSDCDVDIKFDGITKLKQIRPLRTVDSNSKHS